MGKVGKGKDVETYVKSLDPPMMDLTKRLHTIIKKALPHATETIKWGNPTYTIGGKNVAWVLNYKDHVDLGFFMGAKLKSKLLEGTGKGLRHIKIWTESDINEDEFTRLLKDAAKLVL